MPEVLRCLNRKWIENIKSTQYRIVVSQLRKIVDRIKMNDEPLITWKLKRNLSSKQYTCNRSKFFHPLMHDWCFAFPSFSYIPFISIRATYFRKKEKKKKNETRREKWTFTRETRDRHVIFKGLFDRRENVHRSLKILSRRFSLDVSMPMLKIIHRYA